MSRPFRRVASHVGWIVFVALTAVLAEAQQQPPHPFAPTWANLAGARVFADKGCSQCHAIRGFGAVAGPDLGRIDRKSFYDLGAAMSNHLRGVAIRRPTLTPEEVTSLIGLLYTVQYYDEPGDPRAGERLYAAKGCVQCHEVGGKGGQVGPGLDFLKRANSPILVAAAMWNHGPEMAEAARARGIPRPAFVGKEMGDLIAYIVAAAKDGSADAARVTPGTPERGEKLFAEKRCVVCHAVGGRGGKVGPELGPRHHVSLTQFAALMWNHGPGMWTKMRERGIEVPRLTGQEMADIVAHLYVSHYFDPVGSAARGQQLAQSKDCLTCHAVGGKGGTVGPDFARSKAVGSAAGLVAAMWNHTRYIEAQRREVPWPLLTGQELADIGAHLAAVSRPGGSKPRAN